MIQFEAIPKWITRDGFILMLSIFTIVLFFSFYYKIERSVNGSFLISEYEHNVLFKVENSFYDKISFPIKDSILIIDNVYQLFTISDSIIYRDKSNIYLDVFVHENSQIHDINLSEFHQARKEITISKESLFSNIVKDILN